MELDDDGGLNVDEQKMAMNWSNYVPANFFLFKFFFLFVCQLFFDGMDTDLPGEGGGGWVEGSSSC